MICIEYIFYTYHDYYIYQIDIIKNDVACVIKYLLASIIKTHTPPSDKYCVDAPIKAAELRFIPEDIGCLVGVSVPGIISLYSLPDSFIIKFLVPIGLVFSHWQKTSRTQYLSRF